MIYNRPHKIIKYPVNPNVPVTAMRLGEILAVYEKTGALNAPVIEGGFEVDVDEDGNLNFPEESTPHNVSKLDIGKKTREAMFPNPTQPTPPSQTE